MGTIERIYQFIDYKAISVSEFSNNIGVSNGYLAKQRSNNANIGSHIIEKIVRMYPEINIKWLIIGEGDMIATSEVEVTTISRSIESKIDTQQVPLYDIEAAAGFTMIINEHSIPTDYLSIPNLPSCDGAVIVRGTSMTPILNSGDIVVFKIVSNIQYILWNEIYIIAFEIDNDFYTVIKQVKKSKIPDHIQLFSTNEQYEPMDIPISSIRQLAAVRASVHYHSM